MEKENTINPEFIMDVQWSDKPISTEKLMKHLEKEGPCIRNAFRRKGFITSREYPFITCANFDLKKNCTMDEKKYKEILKNDEEVELAKTNLKCIEKYLKMGFSGEDIELAFYHDDNGRCALVNRRRRFSDSISNVVCDYFSREG